MGEIGSAVLESLQQGISSIVSEEFPLMAYSQQASDLYFKGESLMGEAKLLTQAQRIVNNAANATKRNFQAAGLKQEIKAKFEEMLTQGVENITADHGHTEDDELLALVTNLTQAQSYSIDQIAKMFDNYYQKYKRAIGDLKNSGIDDKRRADIENDILKFMRNGYMFLAKLGEEIRATPILYEVTVNLPNGGHKTGHFTLEELMANTRIEMHRGTYQLRLGNVNNLQHMATWSSGLNSAYETWRTDQLVSQNNWNEGEKIERFREEATYIFNAELERALGMTPAQIAGMDPHGRHYFIHSTLNLSYTKGPDFFANIDKVLDGLIYEDDREQARDEILMASHSIEVNGSQYIAIQEKAEGATFTNLGGLLRSLKSVSDNLSKLNATDNIKSKLDNMDDIDTDVQQAILNLVKQFLPGAS